jgi:hypothetical protein
VPLDQVEVGKDGGPPFAGTPRLARAADAEVGVMATAWGARPLLTEAMFRDPIADTAGPIR